MAGNRQLSLLPTAFVQQIFNPLNNQIQTVDYIPDILLDRVVVDNKKGGAPLAE